MTARRPAVVTVLVLVAIVGGVVPALAAEVDQFQVTVEVSVRIMSEGENHGA